MGKTQPLSHMRRFNAIYAAALFVTEPIISQFSPKMSFPSADIRGRKEYLVRLKGIRSIEKYKYTAGNYNSCGDCTLFLFHKRAV